MASFTVSCSCTGDHMPQNHMWAREREDIFIGKKKQVMSQINIVFVPITNTQYFGSSLVFSIGEVRFCKRGNVATLSFCLQPDLRFRCVFSSLEYLIYMAEGKRKGGNSSQCSRHIFLKCYGEMVQHWSEHNKKVKWLLSWRLWGNQTAGHILSKQSKFTTNALVLRINKSIPLLLSPCKIATYSW